MKEINAAVGVKISCQNVEGVIAGASIMVVGGPNDPLVSQIKEESQIKVNIEDSGLTIKADAVGSLEALAFEAEKAGIKIRKYGIGEITRRDIVEAAFGDKENRAILGFNVTMSKDAETELHNQELKVFTNPIVYQLIEDYLEWKDESKRKTESDKRAEFAFPQKSSCYRTVLSE